jgi:hypothetical protein
VWGADVEVEDVELWDRLRPFMDPARSLTEARRIVARTNIRRVVDNLSLERDFVELLAGRNWWGGMHHGLGLTTIEAPIARALEVGRAIIASTHCVRFSEPGCSNDETDNAVKWTGGAVEHDCYDISRQEKISQVLAPYMRSGHDLPLAVCYDTDRSAGAINCGRCEKCLRTATGLRLVGIDPRATGIPVDSVGFDQWRQRMDGDNLRFPKAVPLWADLQESIRDDEADPYLRWLRCHDLSRQAAVPIAARAPKPLPRWRFEGKRLARRLPFRIRRLLRLARGRVRLIRGP